MKDKTIALINFMAALLVLFAAFIWPWISVILAVVIFAGFGIYHFNKKNQP